nr:MAG TPA: zinc-ribbon domain protein [Caudoviricetes sp.]
MIKNGWVICPKCGRKLFPVRPDTVIKHLMYQCRHCKEKFEVNT